MISKAPAYSVFARVYDQTMAKVPYENWAKVIHSLLGEFGLNSNSNILDIACGTAKLTELLKKFFPKIMGLDYSFDMLKIAQKRKIGALFQADMCQLPFARESFHAALSTHDSVNYLGSENKLMEHLFEVYRVLKIGGIYLFDLSSEENVLKNFHKKIFHEWHGKTELIWYNEYDKKSKIIHSYLTFRNGTEEFYETHDQYIFPIPQVESLIKKTKFHIRLKFTDYFEPTKDVFRLYCFLLQKTES